MTLLVSEVGAGVCLLVLDRPRARNALDAQLLGELCSALEVVEADSAVRAVVLTGTDPAFCAGLDLKAAAADGAAFASFFQRHNAISRLGEMTKPVIGAVNGAAFTGGLELALSCDFLIASERASFADTHARLGLLPVAGMTARLPALVGSAVARRLSMSGEVVAAPQALRWGLVTEVVPHDALLARAVAVATDIAAAPADSMMTLKRQFHEGAAPSVGAALDIELRIASEGRLDFSGAPAPHHPSTA